MNIIILSVLAFKVILVRCASANLGRIIGGEDAIVGEAPYVVIFAYNGSIYCTGSIIHTNWVLTSAQCIKDETFHVIAGAYYIQSKNSLWDAQVRTISNLSHAIIHDSFDEDSFDSWDIALVYLTEPFKFKDRIHSIKIPEHQFEKLPRGEAFLFGWGYISGGVLPERLQVLTTRIISFYECQALLRYDIPVMDFHICTEGPEGICLHDCGGPLVREYDNVRELIGVASWGESPCDSRNSPSVFIRVDKAADWIRITMAKFNVTVEK